VNRDLVRDEIDSEVRELNGSRLDVRPRSFAASMSISIRRCRSSSRD